MSSLSKRNYKGGKHGRQTLKRLYLIGIRTREYLGDRSGLHELLEALQALARSLKRLDVLALDQTREIERQLVSTGATARRERTRRGSEEGERTKANRAKFSPIETCSLE
jgi:hypothetical protein